MIAVCAWPELCIHQVLYRLEYSSGEKKKLEHDFHDLHHFDIVHQAFSNWEYIHWYRVEADLCEHSVVKTRTKTTYIKLDLKRATHAWCGRSLRVK